MSEKKAYSLDEAAAACGVSVRTLRDAITSGDLLVKGAGPKRSKPIVLAADLDAWLDSLAYIARRAS